MSLIKYYRSRHDLYNFTLCLLHYRLKQILKGLKELLTTEFEQAAGADPGGPGGPGPLGFEAPKLSIFGPYLIFP